MVIGEKRCLLLGTKGQTKMRGDGDDNKKVGVKYGGWEGMAGVKMMVVGGM